MHRLDENSNVVWWSSEELAIPYRDPSRKGQKRSYYPDFVVCALTKSGEKRTLVIEVKPTHETRAPDRNRRRTKRMLYEATTYATNEAKWNAAREYCERRGYVFTIWTERDLWKK